MLSCTSSFADDLPGALESMIARPEFQVELMACEPLTMDPVAFAWGADGKFWIVEMADYPLGIDGKGTPGGRVRYLVDRDGDGRYDSSTLFLDGLSYPNGIMPWRKGVLVTCAPEIFYAEDTDGDGRADVRKPLYRGFGEGNPQHRVNGLRWGLDNWIYCANGDSGGGIESVITGEKLSIAGRDFRIRPDEGLIEAQTGQTQFVRERDDWGNWFGNSNANPMYHFVLDDHYLRRNPHVVYPDARVPVSLAPGAAPVFPASRTLPRFNDQNAANRFTSACSAIIYRDNLFGSAFAGNSFVSEPVHNLVHREVVFADGFTFHSRRADDERQTEFLASTDNWCRPAMIRVGPDGALWVADMYREVIEHPEWIPKEVQAKFDLRAGADKGRIYRVYPRDAAPRALPRLDLLDTAGLVAALDSPSGWQRDMVQQLLVERQDSAAVPLLKAMLADAARPPLARLHAICTLDGLKAIDAGLLKQTLGSHPGIDRHVVRLSEPFLDQSPDLTAAISTLADSDDPQLLMQLAYTLGESHSPHAGDALARLALRTSPPLPPEEGRGGGRQRRGKTPQKQNESLATTDTVRYLHAAILSSINTHNLPRLAATLFASDHDLTSLDSFIKQVAMLSVVTESGDAVAAVVERVTAAGNALNNWQIAALEGLFDGMNRRRIDLKQLAASAPEAARASIFGISQFFAAARAAARDPAAAGPLRLRAIELLGRLADERAADLKTLADLLAPQTPTDIQSAAVAALARAGGANVPELLLAGWPAYGPDLRGQVIDALIGREPWLKQLLAALETQSVPAVAVDVARRQRILQHANDEICTRAEKLFAGAVNADRQQVIDRYRAALSLTSSAKRGAAVFKKSCASCHRLGDVGHVVGPDLSALSDRSPSAMLTAIFDPNRAVEAKFLAYTAITEGGVTYNGILASESGSGITLLAADGKEIALVRSELDALASTNKSLMPEGLEKDLTPQNVADLLAFLSGFRPPRRTFEGNEPKLVQPEGLRGEFWLLATDAEIYGQTLVFEPQYRNLGYWQSDNDHAAWSLDVVRAGKYAVSLDYACENTTAGQSVAVEIAGQRLTGKVPGTGNWDTYRQLQLGHVELSAGRHELIVHADGRLRGALLDLKSVRLRPIK